MPSLGLARAEAIIDTAIAGIEAAGFSAVPGRRA